ncbi:MAG: ABC transporter ATP-binding protein [Limisphaerales bacterium]
MKESLPLAIDVHNLTKRFGKKTVVNRINLLVPQGKVYGFLGPNGSGKTTTIRMICGLLTPDEGEGTCLGYDLRKESENIRKNVGYMTQRFSFWEDLTIRENLNFVSKVFGVKRAKERIQTTLQKLGLEQRADQLAGTLSGGWKQRLALAACTLHEPKLLLLDEPTAGVDPKARREFWDEIHQLASQGITVLVSTHYMDEAERCHAIVYIADGNILSQGTVEEVISQAGLSTWVVEGKELVSLKEELLRNPAVMTAAIFGESLHVSGLVPEELEVAIEPYKRRKDLYWSKEEASLEDAFIYYNTLIKDVKRSQKIDVDK